MTEVSLPASSSSRRVWRSSWRGLELSIRSRWLTNRETTSARSWRSNPPMKRPRPSLPTMTSVPRRVRARRSRERDRWPAVSIMSSQWRLPSVMSWRV
jgi:hypothetical protein